MIEISKLNTLSIKDVIVTLQGIQEQKNVELPVVIFFEETGSIQNIWAVEHDEILGFVKIIGDKQLFSKA